jgi:hypothetical protein
VAWAAPEKAWFIGGVYSDSQGAPVGIKIEAVIGNVVCGEAITAPGAPHGPRGKAAASSYYIEVLSAAEKPGCGQDGETIRFRAGGRFANETAVWRAMPPRAPTMFSGDAAASYPSPLNLVFGPPVTVLSGLVKGQNPPPNSSIQAFVGGRLCGEGEVLPDQPLGDAWYVIIVRSEQATQGCAKAGAAVELRINGQPVRETIDASPGFRPADVTLTSPHPVPADVFATQDDTGRWALWAGLGVLAAVLALTIGLIWLHRRGLATH